MCYFVEVQYNGKKYKIRFKTQNELDAYRESGNMNGFDHPDLPVIFDDAPRTIDVGQWGLLPGWAKDDSFANNTLNAKVETIGEKPAFRSYANNRCMVLIDAFFEWQWKDDKGKVKQKYRIYRPDAEPFALAAIWSEGKKGKRTISIVTTEANTLMATIHNNKKRMPIVLTDEEIEYWLQGGNMDDFKDRSSIELIADPINADGSPAKDPEQKSLFE